MHCNLNITYRIPTRDTDKEEDLIPGTILTKLLLQFNIISKS